ncbi:universal stress protein [Shewanella gelidii]|uniref:Universal stress protein A n=1 Tax=Shewanella gelidii TaxID=1642821 RepID=A0A917JMK0_9GAMM|nr:universal stress protein [Shewanella gelidii]MCL1099287.1 universal stress protein [Shewanella gelidii]GGI77691.1 universal stress protein A [Shewanella gelidii]
MRTRQVLCPTDFSETANHALSYAVEMANFYKVGLRILHVISKPYGETNYGIVSITPSELEKYTETYAAEKMRDVLAHLQTHLRVETIIRRGSAVGQILEEAENVDVGMIVMASHGLTGVGHFLHASVAEEVAIKAKKPVLVVK